jgi:hypothetical protein
MNEKLDRYVELYNSGVMTSPFPHVLILSDQCYAIDYSNQYPFKIFQSESFTQFVNSLTPAKQVKVNVKPVKIKIGR